MFYIDDDDDEPPDIPDLNELDGYVRNWLPHNMMNRTNWLHRVDALRVHDIREMNVIWEVAEMCLEHCNQFVLWAYVIQNVILDATDIIYQTHLKTVLDLIIGVLQMLCSEGYCYFLDYMRIAYFPNTNRPTQFPAHFNSNIDDLSDIGDVTARDMTGLSLGQLRRLYIHLRIPDVMRYQRRHTFTGEECFLHYLVFNRIGETKLRMSSNYFGGDPRRFTYSIRIMNEYLYTTFYHKITGDSMRMWLPQINEFRLAIWKKLNDGYTVEERYNSSDLSQNWRTIVLLSIPFDAFRIFGFLDDTGFRTTAPGITSRRIYGFFDDVQRAFYSAYFAGHGLKVQTLTLPNGMIGSVYIGAWRVSDAGLLNMSGLDTYLAALFNEYNIRLPAALNQFPAVYGDGIFPQLATIVARYGLSNENESRVNRRLASVRQSIEHIFGFHSNTFELFNIPNRFKLLVHGVDCQRMVVNSFFLLNCFICFNETPNNFDLRPPTIEAYLPIDEELVPAPHITDEDLGEVYNYHA